MEINKIIVNSLNAADVNINSTEADPNEELQTTQVEEAEDEDAALELEEDTEKSGEADSKNKYSSKSTYMSELLKLDNPNEDTFGIKDFISNEVNSAKSIGQLKDLLMNLQTLEMNTQLKVMDVINSISFDEDLQTAKYMIKKILQ